TSPSAVRVGPSNGYVLVANAGSNDVSSFTLDATGKLTSTGAAVPLPGSGTKPYSIAIDPSGSFAYTANFGSGSVSVFTIAASGALTALTSYPAGAGPAYVT